MRMILFLLLFPVIGKSQTNAFSSLQIPSSARGLGMGDVGISSATGNGQLYYNMAKTAFTQNYHQVSVSYMPWFSGISNDTRFMCANYLANISASSAMGLSVNYLDLGNLAIRDNNGAILAYVRGSEYHLTGSYALELGSRASLGLSLRAMGENLYGISPKSAFGVSGDLGYYQYALLGSSLQRLEWGVVVSNFGPAIDGSPLPTNLGIGLGYSGAEGNGGDSYSVSVDANRLLIGDNPLVRITAGGEYGFASQFFLRGGLSYEPAPAGNRKFFGLGAGYKGYIADQSYGLDFYYLVPFGVVGTASPFQNGFGMTLHLNFGNFQ